MSILDLLRSDGSIVVNKKLARNIGLDSAIMYSELISKHYYFEARDQLTEDGFFFNTVENMEVDTTLSKYQQTKAIKQLKQLGLIKHSNRGIPQKRYFKVIKDEVMLLQFLTGQQKAKNSPIKSKEREQLKVKEVSSNNTNSNNTKNNIKLYKGESENSHRFFSFNDFKTKHSPRNDLIEVVEHYMSNYENYRGMEHPRLKEEQWEQIKENMFYISDDGIDFDIDESSLIDMIDKHFITKYKNGCDYNILHFMNDRIRIRRMYEVAY